MKRHIRSTLAATLIACAGCTASTYDYAYYDPYLYYGYYPSDLYYSSYYWVDPYYTYYYGDTGQLAANESDAAVADGGSADAGAATDGRPASSRTTVGDVLRALARGEDVCGSHVTVTPRTIQNPCPTDGGTIRGGATIAFNGCQLSTRGTIDGTIDVQSTRTASDTACNANTTITIASTTKVTNLTYSAPSGRKLVIPSQTTTGMTSFLQGQKPGNATAMITGQMQVFTGDALAADRSYTGNVTVTPSSDRSTYTIDGTLTLQDQDGSGTTVVTAAGLTRGGDCCRPTGGTLSINRTGQGAFSQHSWTFLPACGSAKFDNDTVTMATCP